ncbi:unnamed protein product [Sphagnum balticum]
MKSEIFLHHAKSRTLLCYHPPETTALRLLAFLVRCCRRQKTPHSHRIASHGMRILPQRCVPRKRGLALRAKCERDKPAMQNSEAKE